jgi:hypothetical protein
MCHLVWLLSRKYGTVWYHPASSKLWYLTSLSFVIFQEKLTGTSFLLFASAKPAFRLAVCLTLGALFASTQTNVARPAAPHLDVGQGGQAMVRLATDSADLV